MTVFCFDWLLPLRPLLTVFWLCNY